MTTADSPDDQLFDNSVDIETAPGAQLDVMASYETAELAERAFDERLTMSGQHAGSLHLPARMFGECEGDHLRRGAPLWSDMPDEPPLGEEGGTAWTPDNAWLREELTEV